MPKVGSCVFTVLASCMWVSAGLAGAPCGTWSPVPLPSAVGNGLASVSASSASDVWALWKGVYHWDGASWSLIPAQGMGSPDTVLRSVAAVAPGHAWAAGWTAFLGSPQTLVQRWDGSKWSVVPSPVIAGGSQFDAITAVNAGDAWAVGSRAGGHPDFQASRVTLTARWDGSQWTAVPSPNVSNRSHELLDVTAIAANDVWAVGSYRNIAENYQTLILHWNGSSWSITPSPNYPGENVLHGVSGTAANDVWAVGAAWDGVTWKQIFLHWDGASWTHVTGPNGPTACVGCTGDVVAMAPNDVWAVGGNLGHWDGTQWSLVPNPEVPETIGIGLRSIAKVGTCAAWAVGGSFDAEGAESALALRLAAGGGMVNEPPIAHASASPASGPGPLEVHFSSAGSTDLDGAIVSYHWSFGDGAHSTSSEPHPVHTYLQTGALQYHATLLVRDDRGAMSEASVLVRITPPLHVESQDVLQIPAAASGEWRARDVITVTDRDLVPIAGVTVTAQFSGPTSGIVTGTTAGDGSVTLESSATPDAIVPWCFTVIDLAKAGCFYVPASNTVTTQCESATASTPGTPAAATLALRVRPNPMRDEGVLHLTLPSPGHVRITVFDLAGRKLRELVSAPMEAGDHVVRWDGRDASGVRIPQGVGFVRVVAGSQRVGARVLRTP